MSVCVIVGSAFSDACIGGRTLQADIVDTDYGSVIAYEYGPGAFLIVRHGAPHRWLPHQIPYRAHAAAAKVLGCSSILLTSSVGVLDPNVPLFEPLIVTDLLMPDNRLPDGSACTMFRDPSPEQGHLVIDDGLFSTRLNEWLVGACLRETGNTPPGVVFGYVGGPRTKTPAENRLWLTLGAQVNSMSVGPECVLANELEMSTAALVVGHKYSIPGVRPPPDRLTMSGSLVESRRALERLVVAFLEASPKIPFANRLHRFG